MERCIMTLKNIIDEALNSQQLAMSVKELENVANNKMLGQQLGLKLNADAAPQFQQLAKQILDQKKKELMQATAAEQAQQQAAAKAQQPQAAQANGAQTMAGQTANNSVSTAGQTANA